MLLRSAIIPTPRQESRTSSHNVFSRALTFLACAALLSLAGLAANAQTSTHKKKSPRPHSPACQTGCKPDTTAPALDSSTPEDAAAQQELAPLARNLHHGTTADYDKLAAFANKHAASVWGQRAALALGYDDYSKARFLQALAWFEKAKADPLLGEYTLFWTAQTDRALHKNGEAAQEFAALLQDYPGTVIKEQLLEAYVPTTIDVGRPQEGLEALAAYAATSSKPALILDRARAHESARKLVDAVKDYQMLYYKFPMSDEAKDAALALPRLNKQLGKEFPYATADLQDGRAENFYDAHKWKEARVEYEKLAAMLKDPANPTRQRALIRAAESRQHPKARPYLLANLNTSDPEADAERLFTFPRPTAPRKKKRRCSQTSKRWPKNIRRATGPKNP